MACLGGSEFIIKMDVESLAAIRRLTQAIEGENAKTANVPQMDRYGHVVLCDEDREQLKRIENLLGDYNSELDEVADRLERIEAALESIRVGRTP